MERAFTRAGREGNAHQGCRGVRGEKSGPTVIEGSVPVEGAPNKPKAEGMRFRFSSLSLSTLLKALSVYTL
jgi:hypothetical protein